MPDLINPYNFVTLRSGPDRSGHYPGLRRTGENVYTGVIECRLEAIGALFTAGERLPKRDQDDEHGNPWFNTDGSRVSVDVLEFMRDGSGARIIQGTSLKGLIRAVYESIVDACLPLAATTGESYSYSALTTHRASACNAIDKLCEGCRLFGKIELQGEFDHCQGRVCFSDATFETGPIISHEQYLRELSGPKPRHTPTYGKQSQFNSEIAGRKFYYHHKQPPQFSVNGAQRSPRASIITEYAARGAVFRFRVLIDGLAADELGTLLLSLELDAGLGHKLGMGKSIGLGSCRISVLRDESQIYQGAGRYHNWNSRFVSTAIWMAFKRARNALPADLIEVLRLNKGDTGETIAYPSRAGGVAYPNARIDALGIFGGDAVTGGQPTTPPDEAQRVLRPAPNGFDPNKLMWLKEEGPTQLVFETHGGVSERRLRKHYQGDPASLKVGHWYLVKGERAFGPIPRYDYE